MGTAMLRMVALVGAACVSERALAVHAGDVALEVQAGRIVTGAYAGGGQFVSQRVFSAVLGPPASNQPHFNDSPGFDCNPGTFPAGSRNGFRILDALRVWDGQDFDAIAPERMELAFGTSLARLTPVTPQVVDGFTLSVASNGTWHRHLEYTLLPEDVPGAVVTPGVYLLNVSIFSNQTSIQESEPLWIVFGDGVPQAQIDAAAQWVEDTLVSPPAGCDGLDFNNDGIEQDPTDIEAFLSVYSGGPCVPGGATCNDIDFNNDGIEQDPTDIEAFLNVYSGGPCA